MYRDGCSHYCNQVLPGTQSAGVWRAVPSVRPHALSQTPTGAWMQMRSMIVTRHTLSNYSFAIWCSEASQQVCLASPGVFMLLTRLYCASSTSVSSPIRGDCPLREGYSLPVAGAVHYINLLSSQSASSIPNAGRHAHRAVCT